MHRADRRSVVMQDGREVDILALCVESASATHKSRAKDRLEMSELKLQK